MKLGEATDNEQWQAEGAVEANARAQAYARKMLNEYEEPKLDEAVNEALLAKAPGHCVVLHCLPAHYGEETVPEATEHPKSRVFDQAENRLHAQKAILEWLLTSGG